MALLTTHKDTQFGVGDLIRVSQRIKEGEKTRLAVFEGMVIAIKNREENKSFTVRKIGANQIGVERIFPVGTPTLEKVEVVKNGTSGSRRAKLYYTREKHKREVDEIYARAAKRVRVAGEQKAVKPKTKAVKKVATNKTSKAK
jgi:large subunit ribosomal protein L19